MHTIKHTGKYKPAKVGVYRRDNHYTPGKDSYSKWNGEFWCAYAGNKEGAQIFNNKSDFQEWDWYEELDFKNQKFRTPTREVSEEVQKKLFAMGYKWNCGRDKIQYTDNKFLYTNNTGYLSFGNDQYYFDQHDNTEVVVEVAVTVTFKECVPEVVEFNGKKYDKKKLEEALKAIEQL